MGKSAATLRKRYERAKGKLAKHLSNNRYKEGKKNEQLSKI